MARLVTKFICLHLVRLKDLSCPLLRSETPCTIPRALSILNFLDLLTPKLRSHCILRTLTIISPFLFRNLLTPRVKFILISTYEAPAYSAPKSFYFSQVSSTHPSASSPSTACPSFCHPQTRRYSFSNILALTLILFFSILQ